MFYPTASIGHRPRAGLLAALSIAGLLAASPSFAQDAGARRASILVEGHGEASAAPDEARLSFTVVKSGESAKTAVAAASETMQAVLSAMRDLGAEDRDLQTAYFQISPQYNYEDQSQPRREPQIIGYEARNSLTVTVRRIEAIGDYLDKAVEAGVNQGGDIAFSLADPTPLLNEARRKAVADGRAKAALYAEAAGVELGSIRKISERMGEGPSPMAKGGVMRAMAEASPSVPVEIGEITVSADIRLVYGIDGS